MQVAVPRYRVGGEAALAAAEEEAPVFAEGSGRARMYGEYGRSGPRSPRDRFKAGAQAVVAARRLEPTRISEPDATKIIEGLGEEITADGILPTLHDRATNARAIVVQGRANFANVELLVQLGAPPGEAGGGQCPRDTAVVHHAGQ